MRKSAGAGVRVKLQWVFYDLVWGEIGRDGKVRTVSYRRGCSRSYHKDQRHHFRQLPRYCPPTAWPLRSAFHMGTVIPPQDQLMRGSGLHQQLLHSFLQRWGLYFRKGSSAGVKPVWSQNGLSYFSASSTRLSIWRACDQQVCLFLELINLLWASVS